MLNSDPKKSEPAAPVDPDRYDTVVIGAGQAGLAIGYFLAKQGRRFVILEAANAAGAAWRGRWDSLVLFTPRRYDALPGLAFPGDPDGYPTRDEVVAYLDKYAATFDLPIEFDCVVQSVRQENGAFRIGSGERQIEADQVVIATGPFQQSYTPAIGGKLAPEVFQLHSAAYRRPSDVPDGRVLIVGGGNTGFQIAEELSATHDVQLAIGSRQTPLPQKLLGRNLFWWLTRLRLLSITVDSRLGRRASEREALIGSSPRDLTRNHRVALVPRVVDASGQSVTFADASEQVFDAVIWSTGYRPDYEWIDLPVLDDAGRPVHHRGVTDIPGLYFLGLAWQHTRGSALLGWVKEDAEFISTKIKASEADQRKI